MKLLVWLLVFLGVSTLIAMASVAVPGSGKRYTAVVKYINSADLGSATTATFTTSYTSGLSTGRLLVVALTGDAVAHPGHDDVTGITYGGTALTLAAKHVTSSTLRDLYIYYLLGSAVSGANNFIISASHSHFLEAVVGEYSGVVGSTGQLDSTTTNTSGAGVTSLTTSNTIINTGSWVMIAEQHATTSFTTTAGTGDILRVCGATENAPCLLDSNGPVAAGSDSFTTNVSSADILKHVIAAFR